MTFHRQSMDEFDTLLLAAVRKGDIVTLQIHLSSMIDPNVYLNRVYDEPNEQKCTLLMIACLNGYEDIVYMLLNCFQFDLEVLNAIEINDKDGDLERYQDVTVLWAAVAIDHFLIVKRLVEQGARLNHKTKTDSTALRCACCNGNVSMARYLVENGAYLHITRQNNDTNLLLSIDRKHLKMTAYLVDELGYDVNECDKYGRSPLYFAVGRESLEIIQFLLNRGARNFPATDDQMSPLMLAADGRHSDLVDAISPYCSLLERIEAEELLGSAFACIEQGPYDLQKSFKHLSRALELRSAHNLPKILSESTIEIFNNRQECQTVGELEELRLNPENMYIEALLVRERLFGPASGVYRCSVINRGVILAENAQFDRSIALWLYDLELCWQYSISIDPEDLRRFVFVFSDMILQSAAIPIQELLKVLVTTVEEVKCNSETIDENLYTALFLITIVSQPPVDELLSATDHRVFSRLLYSVNQDRYVTHNDCSTLLHLSLRDRTSASDDAIDNICKYPCLRTVRTLLQCGADVNAMNAAGNTPLHELASNSSVFDEAIFQLLYDAGAHIDFANTLGQTPIDIASNSSIKELLREKMKLSLKCLCARLIQKNGVPFHETVSISLVSFIERH